jgi:hypothetical protein
LKTKGHKLIGRYLMENLQCLPAQRYKKAFLFGCIEPDYNPFTYLKGSRKARLLRGHNYSNAAPCILHTIKRLQKKQDWRIREYYQLGKLIHYITDAFTYAHNESFGKSIRGHRRYEFALHSYFADFISASEAAPPAGTELSAMEYLVTKHRQYSIASTGPKTDTQYILKTTSMVFSRLLPDSDAFAAEPLREAVT